MAHNIERLTLKRKNHLQNKPLKINKKRRQTQSLVESLRHITNSIHNAIFKKRQNLIKDYIIWPCSVEVH